MWPEFIIPNLVDSYDEMKLKNLAIHSGLLTMAGMILCAWTNLAFGNEPPANPSDVSSVFPATAFITQRETWTAFAVLIFGAIMSIVAVTLLKNHRVDSAEAVRVVALIIIVVGSMFLVAAGYSSDQIAPILGLMGTIAGYLLGKTESRGANKLDDEEGP